MHSQVSEARAEAPGLLANLVIGVFLLPTLYVWVAGDNDILPAVESDEEF